MISHSAVAVFSKIRRRRLSTTHAPDIVNIVLEVDADVAIVEVHVPGFPRIDSVRRVDDQYQTDFAFGK